MVTPKNTPLLGTIAAIAVIGVAAASALRALGTDGILSRLTLRAQSRAGGTLEEGKMLAILDEKRTKGTLKGVFKSHLKKAGFDDETAKDYADGLGHSYKCARVFTAYVGTSLIAETDYDAGKVTWFVPVCAIENHWDSKEGRDATKDEKRAIRQRIAAILIAREVGTEKALTAIKNSVLPQREERDADGEGEGAGEQAEVVETPAEDPRIAEMQARILALEGEVAEKGALVNKLALAVGEMLNVADEDQLAAFPLASFEGCPETIMVPIKGIYEERMAALTAPEAVAA